MNNLINNVLKKNDTTEDNIYNLYKKDILCTLNGVGKKIEQKLIEYFENLYENTENSLQDIKLSAIKTYLNSNDIEKLDDVVDRSFYNKENSDLIEKLYNFYNWLNICELGLLRKKKIFKYNFDALVINFDQVLTPTLIQNDPLILTTILGCGFDAIDNIAKNNKWWTHDCFYRRIQYILYKFKKESETSGNIYIDEDDLNKMCKIEAGIIDDKIVNNLIYSLIKDEDIILCTNHNKCNLLALPEYYNYEYKLSLLIKQILDENNTFNDITNLKFNKDCTDEQKKAVKGSLQNRLSIVTGGPGTGKTDFIIKEICKFNTNKGCCVCIAAPTHSAKSNIINSIENDNNIINKNLIKFYTLQSLLFKSFKKSKCKLENIINSIKCIILEECGMVCSKDFYNFINILVNDYNINILLVGDVNQLPPVGAGSPFKDLIKSNLLPTYKIEKNFRSKNSDISKFCDYINNDYSINNNNSNKNIFKNEWQNIHNYLNKDIMLSLKSILYDFKKKGFLPYNTENKKNNFQIICPTNNAIINNGYVQLVREIFYNKKSDKLFDIGDYIIFKKNTILFKNGDYGKIESVIESKDKYNKKITQYKIFIDHGVDNDYDINEIEKYIEENEYDIEYVNNNTIIVSDQMISPSFVITVHKSQGLGFNNVICIHTNNFSSKELIYTEISRGKNNVYLLGNKFNYISKYEERNTLLYNLLLDKFQRLELDEDTFNKKIAKSNKKKWSKYESVQIIRTSVNRRKKIPKHVRNSVFYKRFGNNIFEGNCFVCSRDINITTFHVGHIVSVSNGGSDNINNLEPICIGCNLSMGTKNLQYYKDTYYKK
tara:strand:- start:618 stop:3101 length:2484 start_codon:yes stop_codon:yes gene_type:complete